MADLIIGFCGGVAAVHLAGYADLPSGFLFATAAVSVAAGVLSWGQ